MRPDPVAGPWVVEKRELCESVDGRAKPLRVLISREAFEDRVQLRRALAGTDYFDLEGVAGDPRSSQQDIDAARFRLEAVMAGGPGRLRDGSEITVERTTDEALFDELHVAQRIALVCAEEADNLYAAWNAVYARGGER